MKQRLPAVLEYLPDEVHEIATSGFVLCLNVRGFWPQLYYTTFPKKWVKMYLDRNLMLADPIVAWTMLGEGHQRWSDIMLLRTLALNDVVMKHAEPFGLKFGCIFAGRIPDKYKRKCYLSVARDDRELTDEEVSHLSTVFKAALMKMTTPHNLTEVQLQLLHSCALGASQADLAEQQDRSPRWIKLELQKAKRELGARNITEAVSHAIDLHFIDPFEQFDVPPDLELD